MYISQLSMHGFKSFARKEKLKFGEGITAVVGPNGCGKTNIVDAVRWVLGEQKYSLLRGKRLDDIIFNGSDSKKPLSVCEVTLVVHNDKERLPIDYTDVEIARRAYRSGESEYMINRKPCRLKDIQNLFADTGMGADAYSVIELRMIEDILSESADDRRKMFEEAAGITKYKHQRRSTLLKLQATRSDLDRVNDIIVEVDSKVGGLRLQLKRYDRHARLLKKLEEREVELAFLRKTKIKSELAPLNEKISVLRKRHSTETKEEKGRETRLDELRRTYREQESELKTLQQDLDELSEERQGCNNQILVLKEQRRSAERTIERLQVEIKQTADRIGSYEFHIRELEVEMAAFGPRIDEKQTEYRSKKAEHEETAAGHLKVEEDLERLNRHHIEHLRKLNELRALLERTQQSLDEKVSVLDDLEKQSQEAEGDRMDLEETQKQLFRNRKRLEGRISNDRKEMEKLSTRIQNLRSEKHGLTLKFHRIANQVESLESQRQFYSEIIESKEGYQSGVRHVLKNPSKFPAVLGTVAELIVVSEKYRSAIEASLGSVAQYLVCKTREDALKILDDLQGQKIGNIALIPLDSITQGGHGRVEVDKGDGIIAIAGDVIKAKRSIQPLVKLLFGDVVIVDDSATAERLRGSSGFSGNIADLTGRYYDSTGTISSINGHEEVSVLGRKEKVNELDKAIDGFVKKGNKVQERVRLVDEKLENCEERHKITSDELSRDIDSLASVEKEITRNEYMISQSVNALRALTLQMVSTKHDVLNLEKGVDKLMPKLKRLEEQEQNYVEKINTAREALAEAKQEKDRQSAAIQEIRFELISLENERESVGFRIQSAGDSIRELETRKADLSREVARLKTELKRIAADIRKIEKSRDTLTARYRKKVSVRDLKEHAFRETYSQIENLQEELRQEQKEREKLGEELKKLEVQVADCEGQIGFLENRLRDKYRRDIPEVLSVKVSEEDLAQEIDKIERSIERIGPINMAVKEEFDEESGRLEFLSRQQADLLESEQSLLATMTRIDRAARKQFRDTYEKIRKNFQRTFKLFFDGGEADLDLTGDDDPLEANITILAKPPGKRTRNLRMLSSGEKALTAISLLFAIYLVKPSPFCILDEVDAPLDDNNIGKFTRVLNKFAEDTQFIVVTHNKLTMEAAKYLYGVTMAQSGVSKIVSVKFD